MKTAEVQGMFPCGTSDGRHDFTESYLFQQLSLNRDFDPVRKQAPTLADIPSSRKNGEA